MNAPQIIVICLFAMRLAVHAAKDQQPVDNDMAKYSFWRAVVNVSIWASLLWWGNFWEVS